ncbi:MAG: DUF1330 domain-containing protein [Cyanobacteria bacterium P01_H01_bin.21]
MDVNKFAAKFSAWYGDGKDGNCPTAEQWKRVLTQPVDKSITLVNFFKIRPTAIYDSNEQGVTGEEAFSRYSSVSLPAVEQAGGRFLFVGSYQGAFVGTDEDWDVIAVGVYPNLDALIALHTNEAYRECYHHRTAACERQKVFICAE